MTFRFETALAKVHRPRLLFDCLGSSNVISFLAVKQTTARKTIIATPPLRTFSISPVKAQI